MHDDPKLIKLDQDELETVIPQVGGLVLVVNGAHRGAQAKLLSINVEQASSTSTIRRRRPSTRPQTAFLLSRVLPSALSWIIIYRALCAS